MGSEEGTGIIPMICNETINAARLGLRDAIRSVREFDGGLSDQEALVLLMVVADVEGVPYASRGDYDIKLYDAVRRRFR